MRFRITGMMRIKKTWRKFTKDVDGASEKHAIDKLYSLLGSLNGVRRSEIKIMEVSKCDGEE